MTLLVEGPASWTVDGDNRAMLTAGKLVANVPPVALGFTLETSTATIVDFGTEFGVPIHPSGSSEVQVFEGRVEIRSAGSEPEYASSAPCRRPEADSFRTFEDAARSNIRPRKRTCNASNGRRRRCRGSLGKSTRPSLNSIGGRSGCRTPRPISRRGRPLEVAAAIDGNFSDTNGVGYRRSHRFQHPAPDGRVRNHRRCACQSLSDHALESLSGPSAHAGCNPASPCTTDPRDTFADGLSRDGERHGQLDRANAVSMPRPLTAPR